MTDKNYDYLSKSSVGSPLAFQKSPVKYGMADTSTSSYEPQLSSSSNIGKRQWGKN